MNTLTLNLSNSIIVILKGNFKGFNVIVLSSHKYSVAIYSCFLPAFVYLHILLIICSFNPELPMESLLRRAAGDCQVLRNGHD